MIDAPLALGFTAGMLAAFNPCGFAMLPAYLSFFVGTGTASAKGDHPAPGGVGRALRVGAVVTAGFVAVFGAAGVAVTGLSVSVSRHAPWATLVIGLALIPVGLAVAAGWSAKLSLPRLQKGGGDRSLASMGLFGVSYATVSLSCTLPVFLAAVSTTFSRGDFVDGVAVFGAYALGMGAVLTGLAVAMALARQSLVRRMRSVLPHVQRASGALLAVAGAYVAYYGWFELRLAAGEDAPGGLVDVAGRISGALSNWIDSVGAGRIGLAVAAAVTLAVVAERRRRAGEERAGAEPGEESGRGREDRDENAGADPVDVSRP